MTLKTILTIADTHPLQVLLLGVLATRALRGVAWMVVDRLPSREPDGDRPAVARPSVVI